MGKTRQVVVGNSAAALSAIKAIRQVDTTCPLTLISAEKCNAYSPVLTTYYIKGEITGDNLFMVDSNFYKANAVRTIFGNKAVGIDPVKQTVYLEDGLIIPYDNLLIATGASPISLGSPDNGYSNVFSLRTIKDAERIIERARTAKEIILVGAGLISLELGDALLRDGVKITVVHRSGQVLRRTVDIECAAIVQKEMESRGISILLGKEVKEIKDNRNRAIVTLDSGEELEADMAVVSIGVRPNMQLVSGSGIKVNQGILVDELMRTSANNIFAAGDVSEGRNLITGEKEVLPNWLNACEQGKIAGLNMAGHQLRHEGGLKESTFTIFGLSIAAIGLTKVPEGNKVEEIGFSDPESRAYRKLLLIDDRIVGATLLGRTTDAGILKNLIKNRKNVSACKEQIAGNASDIRYVQVPAFHYGAANILTN